jgi:hypothetical protein
VPLLALRLENVAELVALFRRFPGAAGQRPGRIAAAIAERVGEFRIDIRWALGTLGDLTALRPLA